MNDKSPGIEGNLEISRNPSGIFIGGDPDGLRSLAKLLCWLADFDQYALPFPDGFHQHVHLHSKDPVDSKGLEYCSLFVLETSLDNLRPLAFGDDIPIVFNESSKLSQSIEFLYPPFDM